MQTLLTPNPSLDTRNVLGRDAFQNVNDMVRCLATLQSGDTRPAGIKNGEFWCKDLDITGGDYKIYRYIETNTPDGVQGADVLWAPELAQNINLEQDARDDIAPSEKAVAIYIKNYVASLLFSVGDFKVSFRDQLDGFLLCDGAAISRTTYKALFDVIGTTFGEGDGTNTFNIPDLRDRFIQGANDNLGTVFEAGLPNITGSLISDILSLNIKGKGAIEVYKLGTDGAQGSSDYGRWGSWSFVASRSSPIYGNSITVQPPAIALNAFIKY